MNKIYIALLLNQFGDPTGGQHIFYKKKWAKDFVKRNNKTIEAINEDLERPRWILLKEIEID